MSTILKTHNLTKIFPPAGFARHKKRKSEGRHAVDHVNMTIRKGDIYGLIGRNGAGKTTLMRLIAGLMPPTDVCSASPAAPLSPIHLKPLV